MKVFDFLNHASIKCHYNGLSVITDPWVISNSFGSWYPNPSPRAEDIYEIIDSDEKMGVVVSHGHDDHLDDWFVKHHLKNKLFFCSKFATPGLENRLGKTLGVDVKPIGDGATFGEFKFNQFINPDFTEYDAVVTIETPDYLVIHANDNWHEWPECMLNPIQEVVKKYDNENIFLLIQFGVADCFPVNYENIDKNESAKILHNRFEGYLSATEKNMHALGINKMYYYANQSLFNYKKTDLDGNSMYELAQKFLSDNSSSHTQLEPGMAVHLGHKIEHEKEKKDDLFSYCLKSLENFINNAYKNIVHKDKFISVRFKTPNENISKNDINYIADIEIWNRILIGELNLESIIIGGSGIISKPDVNIRDHHIFISKRAYVAQMMIRKLGLSFFREHSA